MKLTYQDKVIDFPVIESIEQIKKEFEISDTKNLFKINQSGELVSIESDTFKAMIRDKDTIEAISDFNLG
ncbi:MAG: hypothetical protein KBF99_12370 [Leptospiraceae bacterium]|nr:hypothetical protein [Leptospiraceae bacterium]MBK7056831.1 hypothetical protein [Leptospiraceae bacterium]MBK9501252.1 hypothetical protein [Leptospiraceae bacterium]MBL0265760.1 hypothetical protein [Leptospiraceae bacterium]MBP9163971.1 hypothetical protein [Leptospiraceae bacterium]